ncbi:hypothetical protein EK904_011699 [Melospiza melodia maxima]|nr:hypothetical protein EK904_011699 [Melospiza melodia maxima]
MSKYFVIAKLSFSIRAILIDLNGLFRLGARMITSDSKCEKRCRPRRRARRSWRICARTPYTGQGSCYPTYSVLLSKGIFQMLSEYHKREQNAVRMLHLAGYTLDKSGIMTPDSSDYKILIKEELEEQDKLHPSEIPAEYTAAVDWTLGRSPNDHRKRFTPYVDIYDNRSKRVEKVHVVLGNKPCDLDSLISTLAYAYFLDKVSPPDVLCLPVLNIPRKDFSYFTETRFILDELKIPESFHIFRDEINLHQLNADGKLSLTLVNSSMLASEDKSLESAVVKVINPDEQCDKTLELQACSSSLVVKEILQEAPELITQQLAYLLRGSILFKCMSLEADKMTEHQEKVLSVLEERFPDLPPREEIISALQETQFNTQGVNIEEVMLKDLKEISDGEIKVAISTVYMTLERPRQIITACSQQIHTPQRIPAAIGVEDCAEELLFGTSKCMIEKYSLSLQRRFAQFKEQEQGDLLEQSVVIVCCNRDCILHRSLIGDLKAFIDKYGFDVLVILANCLSDQKQTKQQVAVYSENVELGNQL